MTRVLGINADFVAFQLFLIVPGEYQLSKNRGIMALFECLDDFTGEVIERFVSGRDIVEMPPGEGVFVLFLDSAQKAAFSLSKSAPQ